MGYNDNHDCPFEAFITNLGKYNEGELVGEWVKFPTTPETLHEVFQRIGIGSKDEFGSVYEEWFITDYDCYVDGLYDLLGEYENLDELNYLASKIEELDDGEWTAFQAAIEMGEHCGSVKDLINLTDNTENYGIIPEVENHYDLGYYYIHEVGGYDLDSMGRLADYIDYEAFGRDVAMEETGEFISGGYVYDNGDRFTEYYDGSLEDIPEEYLVTVSPEEPDELERLEASTDLAYDLDEFFRVYHPEYDRTYMDAHPQKEALADSLLSGSTGKIRMTLAFLEQEQGLAKEVSPFQERLMAYENEFGIDTYSIYQLKDSTETRDYRFEPLQHLEQRGLSVEREHYNLVYAGNLTGGDTLEGLYQKFNLDHPEDFKGHSLSVSDVVVLCENGKETAHYCDSFGFQEVPQFMEPAPMIPDNHFTGEKIKTPRGSFSLTSMTKEQMEAAGYGFHHSTDKGDYLIMANGTHAFAVAAEPENYLKNAEMATEDDYGMIDGIINNGERTEGKDQQPEKPSVLGQLSQAKKDCAERKPPESVKSIKEEPEL